MAFAPTDLASLLAMTFVSMVCWGSWANTFKLSEKRYAARFECFYFDYALSLFFTTAVISLTLGSLDIEGSSAMPSFIDNLSLAFTYPLRGIAALGAGTVFNVSNILFVAAVALCGLAVALPIANGLALVLGAVMTYVIEPRGNPVLLFLGVSLALAAVCSMSTAHVLHGHTLQAAHATKKVSNEQQLLLAAPPHTSINTPHAPAEPAENIKSTPKASLVRGLVISAVSGLLMGCWSPLTTYAMSASGEGQLTPYSALFLLTLAVAVTTPPQVILLLKRPLDGGQPQAVLRTYFAGGVRLHLLALLGGVIWAVGTNSNQIAGRELGFAASYSIGGSAPLVGALWGIFLWKVFEGCSPATKWCLVAMFVLYAAAIALVALSVTV